MKHKNKILIASIITILTLFLILIIILQTKNKYLSIITIFLMIIVFSFIAVFIQKDIDENHKNNKVNYQNLDILKYICSILIIILHLKPFLNYSSELHFAFNNVISRTCVPIFFICTGYFVSKKERDNPDYIRNYLKRILHTYLIWNIIYIPIIFLQYPNLEIINKYISNIKIPIYFLIPIMLIVIIFYSGTYYHLWYFPALILSLLVLSKWKKKFNIKYLLILSFFLLLFGSTETYNGVLLPIIKQFVSYYYSIFFTTRNFLFFGLFYVTLGYFIGQKKEIYSKHCFWKLLVSIFLLVFETFLLHNTKRLNSNILLSCIPLTYYLFICSIYISNNLKYKFQFGKVSKYYYLIHPMIIFIISIFFKEKMDNPYINIIAVLAITHIISILIIKLKDSFNKY